MNMPISNISSGMSYSPALELPDNGRAATRVKFEKPRIDADTLIALVPGNDHPEDSPDIRRVTADIAQVSQTFNKKLQFVVDQQSHEVTVKVIDKTTDKVIKVLPPEELQRLHRKLKEAIGFLFNEEV